MSMNAYQKEIFSRLSFLNRRATQELLGLLDLRPDPITGIPSDAPTPDQFGQVLDFLAKDMGEPICDLCPGQKWRED